MELAIYRDDDIYFNDLINLFIDSSLQISFAYNKVHFYSRKDLRKKIEKLENKIENLFEYIQILLKNDVTSMAKRKILAQSLAEELIKKYYEEIVVK